MQRLAAQDDGSVRIPRRVTAVDLPGPGAADDFVLAELFNRADPFAEHVVRRFEDRLGRTMWDFRGDPDQPRFLVIAKAELTGVPSADVILHGELLTAGDAVPAGVALAAQAPTREALVALLGGDGGPEVHDWEFGGRR